MTDDELDAIRARQAAQSRYTEILPTNAEVLICTDIPALLDELAAARKEVGILKPVVQMYASGFRGSRLAADALDMVKDAGKGKGL